MSTRTFFGRMRGIAAVALAVVAALVGPALPTPAAASETDSAPPTLVGASLGPAAAGPGAQITVDYQAADDVAVARVVVSLRIPDAVHALSITDTSPLDGTVTYTVPSTMAYGDWVISGVHVEDTAGKYSTYYTSGRLVTYPSTGVTTHNAQLTGHVAVTGTTVDGTAPRLRGLTMTPSGYTDEWGSIDGIIDEANFPVTIVRTHEVEALGTFYSYTSRYTSDLDLSMRAEGAGPTRLLSLKLTDAKGNSSTYRRDGSTTGTGLLTTHPFDFSVGDSVALPGRPYGSIRPKPRAIDLMWQDWESAAKTYTGYRVTVTPGNRTVTVPVAKASNFATTQRLTLPATNGTTYRVSVVPTSQWGDGKALTAEVTPLPSTNVFSPGDATGDGKADIIALRATGVPIPNANMGIHRPVYRYAGKGNGSLASPSIIDGTHAYTRLAPLTRSACYYGRAGYMALHSRTLEAHCAGESYHLSTSSWDSMRFIDAGGDFSGDRVGDVVAVARSGALIRYQVNGNGIYSSRQIGSGWGAFLAVFCPGDFNGDRHSDLMALDSTGRLWLYRGNGRGGWLGSRVLVASGWSGFGAVMPLRDLNGDGHVDIGAITMTGDFYLYPGNGRGGWRGSRVRLGSGWNVYF